MITSFATCNKQIISASEEQGKTTQNGTSNLELGGIEAVVVQNQNQQQTNNGSNSSKWARLCGLATVAAMLSGLLIAKSIDSQENQGPPGPVGK